MCGLVGFAAKIGRPADRIDSALLALGHRGPDGQGVYEQGGVCLLYTSPSPRDVEESRMPSSA